MNYTKIQQEGEQKERHLLVIVTNKLLTEHETSRLGIGLVFFLKSITILVEGVFF